MFRKLMVICMTVVMALSFAGIGTLAAEIKNNVPRATEQIDRDVKVQKISENEEIVTFGDMFIHDVTTEANRIITTSIANDTSVYYEDLSTGIATISVNGKVVEKYDMNDMRENITWTMPDGDVALFEEYFRNQLSENQRFAKPLPADTEYDYQISYENESAVIVPVTDASAVKASVMAAAATDARPYSSVTSTYPTYQYKTIATSSPYSSALKRNLSLSVKDSMYSYTLTSKTSKLFTAGTAVSVISGTFKIASGTVINSLIGLTTVAAGVLKLLSDVNYYYSEDYSFYALRQGYVYDYTNLMRDVSVKTEYGSGRISMTWDFISNEYTNPAWKITAQAYPHTLLTSTMFSEAQRIWEANIAEYGYWKWGDI